MDSQGVTDKEKPTLKTSSAPVSKGLGVGAAIIALKNRLWKGFKSGTGRLIGLGILIGLVVLQVVDPLPIQFLRIKTFDTYQNIKPRESLPDMVDPVTVVDIDEKSLAKIGQWPWPRTKIADLVYNLKALGSQSIAFDMVFAEPDRMSPDKIADSLPVSEDVKATLRDLPSNDTTLANAIREIGGGVVLGQTVTDEDSVEGAASKNLPVTSVALLGLNMDEMKIFVKASPALIRNVPELDAAALGRGIFNVKTDVDGIIRKVPILLRVGDILYPALSVEALRLLTRATTILVRAKKDPATGLKIGIQDIVVKPFIIKTDKEANIWIYYRKYSRKIYVSASDVLDGTVDPALIRGKIIFFGTSAAGLKDIRSTPLDRFLPGVDLHAQIIENIFDSQMRKDKYINDTIQAQLKGLIDKHQKLVGEYQALVSKGQMDNLKPLEAKIQAMAETYNSKSKEIKRNAPDFQLNRPREAEAAEFVLLVLVGLTMIIFVPWAGAKWTLLLFILSASAMIGGSWYAFSEHRILLDPVFPTLSALILYVTLTYMSYSKEESERRQVRGAFSRYMSPALVAKLAEDPSQLKLGGEIRDMTLLFCDVRGFTTISEQFDAEGLTKLINKFLTPLTNVILDTQGTIDKYMGDCIMAFWNAPLDDEDHARHACDASMEMKIELKLLNARLKIEAKEEGRKHIPINVGVGLNSGDVCVGNMGSDQRFDYSVLGDTVNLASRLEGQSKTYGVFTVIGDATFAAVPDYATIELDNIKVKGKTIPVRIHALLGGADIKDGEEFSALKLVHDEMLVAFKSQDWTAALGKIAKCRKLDKSFNLTVLYDLYDDRIAAYKADPPGKDWDGVYTATSK